MLMGEVSGIAWTDATFNPWWGCTRVSPGCTNCYAEQLATVRRKLPVWGVDADRKAMSEAYWREPAKWNRKAATDGVRRRVFCASMADVFEVVPERNERSRRVQEAARARLWPLIEATPMLDWLLLTKRPENVAAIVPWGEANPWPSNVWLGVTAEDQRRADERLPTLLTIPAQVRFVSHEPALEAVDFTQWVSGIDWIITGGESGPGARPYDVAWARSIIDQCRRGLAAPFVKQLGANAHDSQRSIVGGWCPGDPEPDTHLSLTHPKGGDLAEWPAEVRVQEFPTACGRP